MAEPFTVRCPECGQRLTSRNPVAPGKILTCPKCDVMFAAPKPPDGDVIDDVEVIDDVDVVEDVEVVDAKPRAAKPRRPRVNEGIEVIDDAPRKPAKAFRSKRKSGGSGVFVGVAAAVVLLLAGGGALAWWLLGSGGGQEPLAYLPSNSPMAGGANIKAILDSPMAASAASLLGSPAMPFGRLVNATGAPMREGLEQVVFGGNESGGTMIIKTAVPIDHDKLVASFGGQSPSRVGGQDVYRLSGPGLKSMMLPNKRIAVFSDAADDQLAGIAGSSGKRSALAGDLVLLAGKFANSTIWFVSGAQALANPALRSGLQSSPAGKVLAPAIQSARGFAVSLNLAGSDVDLRFGLLCPDDATAQKTAAELQQANEKSKTDAMSKAMLLAAPPWARKLNAEAESSAKVVSEGPLAVMSMRFSLSAVQEAIDNVSKLMLPGAGAGGMSQDGGALIPKNRGRQPGG